jgi:hypothetical protein
MDVTPREILERRLRELLASHDSIKIATSSPSGEPWISTAYFLDESPFALAFMMEPGGRTLTNMKANPRVALMLENGDAMALFAQAEGRATVVVGGRERFRDGIAAKTPASAGLVELPGLVPVRIEVVRWKLTDVPGGWLPAREFVAPSAHLAANA